MRVVPRELSTLLSETDCPTGMKLTYEASLTGQRAQGSALVTFFGLVYKHLPPCLFFPVSCGIGLRFSCLLIKHFAE